MTGLSFAFLGLSMTSSWGNGHATTYRGLLRELARRGHTIDFLERDAPYYANHRDLPSPSYARTSLYASTEELFDRFGRVVRDADVVVVGSYVPDGIAIGDWVLANARGAAVFYDIDTPVTLRAVAADESTYIAARQIPAYDLYLSFTGGPTLDVLERRFGAQQARALYCSVDPSLHSPAPRHARWDLGYLGTYSPDRQPALERLLAAPARAWQEGCFVVAGAQYPDAIGWPENVVRIEHLAPNEHRDFYASQRFTLSVTRSDMIRAGYSPSVRLFEAAACATPLVSDPWAGIETFFAPGREILLARTSEDVLHLLRSTPDDLLEAIGERARRRVLAEHTAAHRAETLEAYVNESLRRRTRRRHGATFGELTRDVRGLS